MAPNCNVIVSDSAYSLVRLRFSGVQIAVVSFLLAAYLRLLVTVAFAVLLPIFLRNAALRHSSTLYNDASRPVLRSAKLIHLHCSDVAKNVANMTATSPLKTSQGRENS